MNWGWLLFAGQLVDLVNHLVVGSLHLVEDAQADEAADDGADENPDKASPCGLGAVGQIQHEVFVAEPSEPEDGHSDADSLADDAVLLHFDEFVGCLDQVITHV